MLTFAPISHTIFQNMETLIKTTNPEAKLFHRPAHQGDAGYDLVAFSEPIIKGQKNDDGTYSSIDYIEYDTGVRIAPENAVYALVFPRSSISKTNLVLANSIGVIDTGYRDTIRCRFKYVSQPIDFKIKAHSSPETAAFQEEGVLVGVEIDQNKIYKQGDKIAQLIWMPHYHPAIQFTTSELPPSDRSFGGFGSTGI